ncbi:MAG TPA: hypothetical protein VN414_11055 [Methanosarcina sp.]|nr:hypothetical protein [Methanosarcina sp.]
MDDIKAAVRKAGHSTENEIEAQEVNDTAIKESMASAEVPKTCPLYDCRLYFCSCTLNNNLTVSLF